MVTVDPQLQRKRSEALRRFLNDIQALRALARFADERNLSRTTLWKNPSKVATIQKMLSAGLVCEVEVRVEGGYQQCLTAAEPAIDLISWVEQQDLDKAELARAVLRQIRMANHTQIRVSALTAAYENGGSVPSELKVHQAVSIRTATLDALRTAGALVNEDGWQLTPMGAALARWFV